MFIAKAAGVGGETHTEVADTIGFVPTADLEFCSTTSCGACGSASTGGEENDNSCQDSSDSVGHFDQLHSGLC
ncbi:hypothetical protein C2E21_4797 [Chlorella sorokiniana]|uniref:Uncharacterized protein n=1 Tax=Chlorella sorokiniana TaxID=3076 RepID=A0A2P6TR09_CHLSO|nr:hypothetical protein C2E21_4797 [Chlorella sorokiniana]|eukprot:PRW56491.1 hypothetical protein C2E21_4797 [Chlorella sorokiniana]